MRLDVRMRKVEEKTATTKFEPVDESPPMKNFYINTKVVSSLPFDIGEIRVSISSQPLAESEVSLALPAIPFYMVHTKAAAVQYRHQAERKEHSRRKPRPASSTPELPVTQAYVSTVALDNQLIDEQRPIYFGISAVPETVSEDETQTAANDGGSGGEIDRVDALAALDAFLRDYVRVKRNGIITSRRIWAVWAARWGADPADDVIAGVLLTDVARRFRAVFGTTAVKKPTRIDGISQRYWVGYTI